MRDTGIANRLRAFGLKVVEVDGWQTRGSSTFSPKGSVDHHTADGAGNAPSLRICINGRSDLPGPLCNVLVGRDNTCYVIAAGRANHAGKGGWHGLSGNSSVFGVERENRGTTAEPWRPDQTEAAAKVHAALISGLAHPDPALVCGHREWAPTRKVDAHSVHYGDFRRRIAAVLAGVPPTDPLTPLEDEEMIEYLQLEGTPPADGTLWRFYTGFGKAKVSGKSGDGDTFDKRIKPLLDAKKATITPLSKGALDAITTLG